MYALNHNNMTQNILDTHIKLNDWQPSSSHVDI